MARRKTTIGVGAFGRPTNKEFHEWEVANRIISRRLPLTEDAVFLLLATVLKRNNQSTILKCVRGSKNVGGYRYFYFSPDIDLLEIRKNGIIVGYELKGYRKSGRSQNPPSLYEGLDEALFYLINPVGTPLTESTFAGSIFDYVYLAYPQLGAYRCMESVANLINLCTPLGLIHVDYDGTKEIVKPKKNPFVKEDMKQLFLKNLDAFRASFEYKLSLVQK